MSRSVSEVSQGGVPRRRVDSKDRRRGPTCSGDEEDDASGPPPWCSVKRESRQAPWLSLAVCLLAVTLLPRAQADEPPAESRLLGLRLLELRELLVRGVERGHFPAGVEDNLPLAQTLALLSEAAPGSTTFPSSRLDRARLTSAVTRFRDGVQAALLAWQLRGSETRVRDFPRWCRALAGKLAHESDSRGLLPELLAGPIELGLPNDQPLLVMLRSQLAERVTLRGTPLVQNSLNLRDGPGREHGVVGKLAAGDQIVVLAGEGDWWQVGHGDDQGFVHSDYVQLTLEEAEDAPRWEAQLDFEQVLAPYTRGLVYNPAGYVNRQGAIVLAASTQRSELGLGCATFASAVLHQLRDGPQWLNGYNLEVQQWHGDRIARHFGLGSPLRIPASELCRRTSVLLLLEADWLQAGGLYFFNLRKGDSGQMGFVRVAADGTLAQAQFSGLEGDDGFVTGSFAEWLAASPYQGSELELYALAE